MVKAKTATEDEERRTQDEVQKLTDKHIGEIDKMLADKEKDLLAV
jgi:ribosome recycling factor